ncbi:hypothetical protein BUALT_Bualt03G0160500 [Buddleja alternifolia]|uniref:DUF8204 domain-containing protein n=1 Tax=Buddleja alternifolia TaxID=168488 RepID=A0AAV6XYI3_9LAMI|nr:hypothetical protein BUALT_Bualt03G0160500 [Buddleja alternifolia]
MEASKEGRSLTDFRYGCIGYSLYVDRKEQGSNEQETQTELPVCVGLEVLVDRRVNAADSASTPMTHIHNREDNFPHLCLPVYSKHEPGGEWGSEERALYNKDPPILLYSAVHHGGVNYCSNCFRTISQDSPAIVSCPNRSAALILCTPKCLSIALSTSHSQNRLPSFTPPIRRSFTTTTTAICKLDFSFPCII